MPDNVNQLPIAPKEIQDKYAISGTTLFQVAKADPKDRIDVEIGDSKQEDFYPQLKLMRWDNEVNCSFRIVGNGIDTPSVRFEGEKTVWAQGDIEAHFYDLPAAGKYEGGYEFEIVLQSKPVSNKFDFTIQTKGLDFFYQPPLAPGDYFRGDKRPDNVVGSYAVYHSTKGRWNEKNGKEYKSGKAFHIYRPKVKDALGAEVWADLNIDVALGIMTITVPRDFLDSATYPVSIDPNYGYTSVGGTWTEWLGTGSECFVAELGNAPENGTLNYIHWCLYTASESTALSAFYGDTAGKPVTRLDIDSNHFDIVDTSEPGTFVTSLDNYTLGLISGTPYWAGIGAGTGGVIHVGHDTVSGYEGYFDNVDTPPATWTDYTYGALTNKRFSVYAEYTASGGGDLSTSIYDTVNVSENVTVLRVNWAILLYDTAYIRESVTVLLPVLVKSIYDTVNASELISPALLIVSSIYDSVAVSEYITGEVISTADLSASLYDLVNASEQVAPLMPFVALSLYDTVNASEQVSRDLQIARSVYDTVNVTESVTPNLLVTTSLYDTVNASEAVTPNLLMANSVCDTVNVSEQVSLSLTIPLSLFDTVNVSENVTPRLPFLTGVLYDTLSLTEVVTPLLPVITSSLYDLVAVSEYLVGEGATSILHHFSVLTTKNRRAEVITAKNRQAQVITAKNRHGEVIISK